MLNVLKCQKKKNIKKIGDREGRKYGKNVQSSQRSHDCY